MVLAAGVGSRLHPLTLDRPKAMVPMLGEPVLHRIIRQLAEAGVEQVTVVVGYMADYVRAHTGHRRAGIEVRYVEAPQYAATGTAVSLLEAERYLDTDSLVVEADVLFDHGLLVSLLSQFALRDVAAVAPFRPPMSGTVVTLETSQPRVASFTRAVAAGEMPGSYKTVNLYRFGARTLRECLVPMLKSLTARNPGAYLEDVLAELVTTRRLELFAVDCSDQTWFEVDDAADLAHARRLFGFDGQA